MEPIITVAAIGALASVIVAIINNHNSKKINRKLSENTEELKMQGRKTEEAFRDIMKRDITDLYYRRKAEKWLWQYERESLDAEYGGYKEHHGNTFIDDIYAEMREWEIRR